MKVCVLVVTGAFWPGSRLVISYKSLVCTYLAILMIALYSKFSDKKLKVGHIENEISESHILRTKLIAYRLSSASTGDWFWDQFWDPGRI